MAEFSLATLGAIHYEIDKETGFTIASRELQGPGIVTRDGVLSEQTFNPRLKLLFLSALKESWPHVTEACNKIGISRSTYKNHYNTDRLFKNLVDQVAEDHTDQVERVSVDLAKTNKFAIIDRMATLRANRPDKYDPARVVKIEHQSGIDEPTARKRFDKLKDVIDAEIVRDSMTKYPEGSPRPQNPTGGY